MINDALATRLNAYIPEVLLVTEGDVRTDILNFINTSVVSVDFQYIISPDTADEVISKSLSVKMIDACNNFIQNVVRYGKLCDVDSIILKSYFTENFIQILQSNQKYQCLIALAYLNAGHASLIATQINIKERRNGNSNPSTDNQ